MSSNKLIEIGALALGWYLLTPPFRTDPRTADAIPGTINLQAPLADWLAMNTVFDSLAECEKARDELAAFQKNDLVRHEADIHGLCVRTDDPRLPQEERE